MHSEAAVDAADRRDDDPLSYVAAGLVMLAVVLCGLFYYKWGGAIRTLTAVRAHGSWPGTADGLTTGGAHSSLFYLRRIWIALVYGLVIGATVRAFVSPRRVVALLGRGGSLRGHVAGALTGAPLMLCSCCVTPVFQSVYENGATFASALAVMLASPGLNPAALVLTFILFPLSVGVARVCAALIAVLLLPPILTRLVDGSHMAFRRPVTRENAAEDMPRNARGALQHWIRSLAHVSARTIPLVIVGVLLSSMVAPFAVHLSSAGALLIVALAAAFAVIVALPTFFELPLALIFSSAGAPGAAVAILVAGPLVNLPSLLILGRETRPSVALALATAVWLLAVLAGLAVSA